MEVMIEPDWQIICLKIRSKYKPLSTVGREVGSDERHLNRLARGEVKEPRFMVGVKLLDIYYDINQETKNGKNTDNR